MHNNIEIINEEEIEQGQLEGIALLQSFFTNEQGIFIPKPNIAPLIDDEMLRMVGQAVVAGYGVAVGRYPI